MTMHQDRSLLVKDYRFTIPKDRISEVGQCLSQAARNGQSPYPFRPELDFFGMVLAAWRFGLYANRQDHALTELQVPGATSSYMTEAWGTYNSKSLRRVDRMLIVKNSF